MRKNRDVTQLRPIRIAEPRPEARVRGHHGSKPRGNPPVDRPELERGMAKLSRVLGN